MSDSKTMHRALFELGRRFGFRPLKVSGLEFDLYKDEVVTELLWGDGSEVWKDLCKVLIARNAGTLVKKLVILCRIYPHPSMRGYSYVTKAVEKMLPILKDVEINVIEIKDVEDLEEYFRSV